MKKNPTFWDRKDKMSNTVFTRINLYSKMSTKLFTKNHVFVDRRTFFPSKKKVERKK